MVSIHAPARGATDQPPECVLRHAVSIHAPARGATPHGAREDRLCPVSIHAPARERLAHRQRAHAARAVSIHAPARGATHGTSGEVRMGSSFYPRSREGSDPGSRGIGATANLFLSTLPRGERRGVQRHDRAARSVSIHAPARGATACLSMTLPAASCFYPRSREGSDFHEAGQLLHELGVSIHAPARGATPAEGHDWAPPICFYPRSREGSDPLRRWIS